MPIELTCTSFSFPLLSFEKSLQMISLLEIPKFDVGAHEGASHVQPSEVETDPDGVADRIRRAADAGWGERVPAAAAAGCGLAAEAHRGSVAESPELAARLVESVPGLKLTLDYSHFVAGGPPAESVDRLLAHAGHFHARQAADGRLQASSKDGSLRFEEIVGRLRASGYQGDLCLEYTWQDWRGCWHQDVVSESIVLRDLLRRVLAG